MAFFGSCRGVLLLFLAFLLCPLRAEAQSTIMVNFGRYPSAQAATVIFTAGFASLSLHCPTGHNSQDRM